MMENKTLKAVKKFFSFGIVMFIVLQSSCDPKESMYGGPKRLYIDVYNQSGETLFVKDNWGRCDEYGNIFADERIILNGENSHFWWYMPGIYRYREFIECLEEKVPNAYVELYSYDESSRTVGTLLRRWSLNLPEEGHYFFNEASLPDYGSVTFKQSSGLFIFTILPSDVGISGTRENEKGHDEL
ncbi:MAG: hypothetical protein IJU74_09250 [Bacteroidales bacterium]|nr:hypothetical protein [Bacteroidales bacterium]